MSVIYENQLALAKSDFIKEEGNENRWNKMMELSVYTLRACGFNDAYEVHLAANKFGRRK